MLSSAQKTVPALREEGMGRLSSGNGSAGRAELTRQDLVSHEAAVKNPLAVASVEHNCT